MVADRLLAEVPQAVVVEVEVAGQEAAQVGLDRRLVLRGRRDDLAPRGSCRRRRADSGASTARAAPRSSRSRSPARGSHLDGGRVGLLVGGDEPQRLVERVERSRRCGRRCCGTGCGRPSPSPASAAASRASGESCRRVERVARERPAQVGAALAQPRVQRGRVLDVLLLEVLLVLARGDVEPAGRDEPAALERIARPASRARRTRARARSRAPRGRRSSAPSRARARARARAARRSARSSRGRGAR